MSSTKCMGTDVGAGIQHVLDDQIRMREGAMKLMSACSTLKQALETSKNLLTINARILGLMSGLQRQKEQHVLEEYNKQRSSRCLDIVASDCCKGKIALSDIRVPLMWKDNVHFTGKTGDQSYYAFALIRCGEQVRETPLCEITSADTDMYFSEALIFEDLLPDFKMDFEIYYTVLTTAESVPSLRAPRPSISIRSSSRRQVHFSAPKFCLAGHVQLCVDDVKGCMVSKDLAMGAAGASGVAVLGDITEFPAHPLELWGQICCELAAQPQCMINKTISNTKIKIREEEEMEKEGEKWTEYHGELYHCRIQAWKDPPLKKQNPLPDKVIQLKEDMEVFIPDGGGSETRVHISCASDPSLHHALLLLSSEEAILWKNQLRREVRNLRMWKNACLQLMHIEENRKARISTPSNASFYEQINIGDEPLMVKGGIQNGHCNGDSKPAILLPDNDFKISNKESDDGDVTSSPLTNGGHDISLKNDVFMTDPPIINKDAIISEEKLLDATHAQLISPKEKRVLAMDTSSIATASTDIPTSPIEQVSSTTDITPLSTNITPLSADITPSSTDITHSSTDIIPMDVIPSPMDLAPADISLDDEKGTEMAGVRIEVTDMGDISAEICTENDPDILMESECEVVEKKVQDLIEKVAESELMMDDVENVPVMDVSTELSNSESSVSDSFVEAEDGNMVPADDTIVTGQISSTVEESLNNPVSSIEMNAVVKSGTTVSDIKVDATETIPGISSSESDIGSSAASTDATVSESGDVAVTLTYNDILSTVPSVEVTSTISSDDVSTTTSSAGVSSSTVMDEENLSTNTSQSDQTTVDANDVTSTASEELNISCDISSTIPANEASSTPGPATEDSTAEAAMNTSITEVTSTVTDNVSSTLLASNEMEELSSNVSSTDVSSTSTEPLVVSDNVASDNVTASYDSEAVSSTVSSDVVSCLVSPETTLPMLSSQDISSTVDCTDPSSSSLTSEVVSSCDDTTSSTIESVTSSIDCVSPNVLENSPLEVSLTEKVPEINSTTECYGNVNTESNITSNEGCQNCGSEMERNERDSSLISDVDSNPGDTNLANEDVKGTLTNEIVDSGVDSNSDISSTENDMCGDQKVLSPNEQGVDFQVDQTH